jgi:hypothetical protein
MNVQIRVGLVVRHIVDDAVETERNSICHAEAQSSESADTVPIGVVVFQNTRATVPVAGTDSAQPDEELALTAHQVAQPEVVVQAESQCVGVDVLGAADGEWLLVIVVRRVVAVAFELEGGIGKKHAEATTESKAILRHRSGPAGVLVEPGILAEAPDLDGSWTRRIHVIPPGDRSPHVARSVAAEHHRR